MKTTLLTVLFCTSVFTLTQAQPCTPQGNPNTYGTNNVWIGYVYNNMDLTQYRGYVNEGNAGNPNFDQSFGGDNAMYPTSGCSVNTETFSVRYRLTKTFTSGNYEFTVGGDDGFRLSLDGGATWFINRWNDQAYTTATETIMLNGSYNMVLEFYENGGANRVSFSVVSSCMGSENTSTYGTSNHWLGYVYDGTNFQTYRGMIQRGSNVNGSFDENFGGSHTTITTSSCNNVSTETFSVRFRLNKFFPAGQYTFFIGGDDGYRLSLDGGNTWVVDRWVDQSYSVVSYTATLNGSYNMVLEYYENGGDNRINFYVDPASVLPITLINFNGTIKNGNTALTWKTTTNSNPDYFEIEKSTDNSRFTVAGRVEGSAAQGTSINASYSFTDAQTATGKSFYRLRMVDKMGVITFSPTVTIDNNNGSHTSLLVYPTVVTNGQVSLRNNQSLDNASINIIDVSGRVLVKKQNVRFAAGQVITLETGALNKGVYFVQVINGGQVMPAIKFINQ